MCNGGDPLRTKVVPHLGLAAADAVLQVIVEFGRPHDGGAAIGVGAPDVKVLEGGVVRLPVQVLRLQYHTCSAQM